METFQARPVTIRARRLDYVPSYFANPDKPDNDWPSEWIVTFENGTKFMLPDAIFKEMFTLVTNGE
jgi:hypothetical protein